MISTLKQALPSSGGSGLLSVNEVRKIMGYPPIDTPEADMVYIFQYRGGDNKGKPEGIPVDRPDNLHMFVRE